MTIAPQNVYLYASKTDDYVKCLAAADVAGIPYSQCVGEFQKAWTLVAAGQNLVIAVGGAAVYALYYNPCGWPTPSGNAAGHTPFAIYASDQGISSVRTNYFENAAGYTSLDSLTLAVMLSYYAIHGAFPKGYGSLPRQEVPQQVCVSGASANVSGVPTTVPSTAPSSPSNGSSVGVYASVSSLQDALHAIQLNWPGISATNALGTVQSPFTQVLSSKPDHAIAQAIEQTNSSIWWMSFWTVSWPESGTSFYQAGYDAGQYAANEISAYPGSRRPDYVVIDPEGYNTPAQTPTEFQDFIHGFASGLRSNNHSLQPAFYANQSQYSSFQLGSLQYPAFIAIAPIQGTQPSVTGGNIKGYIAYYASCPVNSDVTQVQSWGGSYNTVQFRDSGVDCGPA